MKQRADIFTLTAVWTTLVLGLSCCGDIAKLHRLPSPQEISAPQGDTLVINPADGSRLVYCGNPDSEISELIKNEND